ncbi:NADH-ubiquinone oxidoreductase-F iron-sulfur binding region domain-containing protein [Entomospira entomophila]|uniref:NADH-ubiquinone oxidoreductase 51kDa subunit iron-sulphur binding domain-containing protein n=1 Tax=Entomospira entomophila TaxID=2719988 RepID=A0A968GCN8_9SPIO|nr:NADH-ubiquinone oxidoreductase-F iron-sulfur binding region domain-containing protein [Entomospira entomophilus]NIZ41006.1 hypothetical protein [Entomospira entomophilus]WDI35219.1 NADH-ubiquinone oxidoreductase-F iron-sulfur binding region domain-containing protein [Entomospira entomophilus]
MNEDSFYLITVSSHKNADEFFKKFKREVDQAAKGKACVMRAQLPDNDSIMVQIYPHHLVYHNLSVDHTTAIVTSLFGDAPLELINHPDAYIDNLATLLHMNMQVTESNICGKCSPCRIGGPLIADLLMQYNNTQASTDTTTAIERNQQLLDVGYTMKNASMCAIGMFGADPLLFAMDKWHQYFQQA